MNEQELKQLHDRWRADGYLVLHNTIDADELAALYETSERVLEQWKSSTSDAEPGRFAYGPTAWVLLHLNHPKYHRERRDGLVTLLNAIAHPTILAVLRELLGEEPVFGQSNYYLNPPGKTRIGAWHRDCQFFSHGEEAEERRLIFAEADPPQSLHVHIPLLPTAATEVVPGSHARWDTPEENEVKRKNPESDMPGGIALHLEPGDIAFFHTNAIHRGMYRPEVPRRTIASTYSLTPSSYFFASVERMTEQRGYVATYQPWFLKPGYLDGITPEARRFFAHFIETYRENWKPEYVVPELGPALRDYFLVA